MDNILKVRWMVQMPKFIQKLAGGFKFIFYESKTRPAKKRIDEEQIQFDFEAHCDRISRYYNNVPKVKSAILSTCGQVMAEGIFLTPAQKRDDSGKLSTYDRAEEARKVCEDLNDKIDVDVFTFDLALRLIKYGTVFFEKTYTPTYDVRIVPDQKYIKPVYDAKTGNQLAWAMMYRGSAVRTWRLDELTCVSLFPDEFYPYGTSLITGVDDVIDSYNDILANFKKWAERQALATDVVQIGDADYVPGETEMGNLKRSVANRTIGETIFTNYAVGKQTLGGGALESESVPKFLELLGKEITDGLMAPPLSALVSSTEASATEVMNWLRAIFITPVQKIIATTYQKELYWPLLEDRGFSVNVIPSVEFNSAEAGKSKEADYWLKLVQGRIASPMQACLELGMEYDEAYWDKQMAQQVQAANTISQAGAPTAKAPQANKVAGDVKKQTKPQPKTGPQPGKNRSTELEDDDLEWVE
jgi:hypothetical protein